jgi:hypothetical protein
MSAPSLSAAANDPPSAGPSVYQLEHHVPQADERDRNQLLAMQQFLERGDLQFSDFEALRELWERESNWRADAANPRSSAYGIPQALTRTHKLGDSYRDSPEEQIRWGLDYIMKRYGSIQAALEHHNRKGWY